MGESGPIVSAVETVSRFADQVSKVGEPFQPALAIAWSGRSG